MTVIRKALVASVVGTLFGVVIGLVSVYRYPPPVAKPRVPREARPSAETPRRTAAVANAAAPLATVQLPNVDSDDIVRRARTLALQPDVRALLTLREQTVTQASDEGRSEAPLTRSRVAEIDRALAKARERRLALDREEFLKQGEAAPPATKPRS